MRLAVVPSLGLHVAPLAIARFRARHPDVSFDVQTLPGSRRCSYTPSRLPTGSAHTLTARMCWKAEVPGLMNSGKGG